MNIYKIAPDIECLILHENGEIYFVPTEYSIKVEEARYTIISEKTYLLFSVNNLYCKFKDYGKNDALHFYKIYFEQSHLMSLKNIKKYSNVLEHLNGMSYDLNDTNIIKFELEYYENNLLSGYKIIFQDIKKYFIENKSNLQKQIDNLNYNSIIIDDLMFSSLSSKELFTNEINHNNSQQCNSPQSTIKILSDQSILNEHHDEVTDDNIDILDEKNPCLIFNRDDGEIYFVPKKYRISIEDNHFIVLKKKYYVLMKINEFKNKIIHNNGNIKNFYTSYFGKSDALARKLKQKFTLEIANLSSKIQELSGDLKIFPSEKIFPKDSQYLYKIKDIKEIYIKEKPEYLKNNSQSNSPYNSRIRKKIYDYANILSILFLDSSKETNIKECSSYIDLSLDDSDSDDKNKNVQPFNVDSNVNYSFNLSQEIFNNDFTESITSNNLELNSLELVDYTQQSNSLNNSNKATLTFACSSLQKSFVSDHALFEFIQTNKNTNSSDSAKSIISNIYNNPPDLECLIIHENGNIYFVPEKYTVKIINIKYTIIEQKTYQLLSSKELLNRIKARRDNLVNFYRVYFEHSSLKNLRKNNDWIHQLNQIYNMNYDLNSPDIIKFKLESSGDKNLPRYKTKFDKMKEVYNQNKISLEEIIKNLVYKPCDLQEANQVIDYNFPCLMLHENGEIYFVPKKYTMMLQEKICVKIAGKIYILFSVKDLYDKISNTTDSNVNNFYYSYFEKSTFPATNINSNIHQELSLNTRCFNNDLNRFAIEKVLFNNNNILLDFKKIKDCYLHNLQHLKNTSNFNSSSLFNLLPNNDYLFGNDLLPINNKDNYSNFDELYESIKVNNEPNELELNSLLFSNYAQGTINKPNLTFAYDASENNDLNDIINCALNAIDDQDTQEQSASNSKRMR